MSLEILLTWLTGPAGRLLKVPEMATAAAKAAHVYDPYMKFKDVVSASVPGQLIGHGLTNNPAHDVVNDMVNAVNSKYSNAAIRDMGGDAAKLGSERMAEITAAGRIAPTREEVIHALETGTKGQATPDALHVAEAYHPIRDEQSRMFDLYRNQAILSGIKNVPEKITYSVGESHFPRMLDAQSQRILKNSQEDAVVNAINDSTKHREIMELGGKVDKIGRGGAEALYVDPITGIASLPTAATPGKYGRMNPATGAWEVMDPKNASFKEAQKIMGQYKFETDPAIAYAMSTQKMANKTNLMEKIGRMQDMGLAEELAGGGGLYKGWSALKIPGFEGVQMPNVYAKYFDKMSAGYGYRTPVGGWLGQLADAASRTSAYDKFNDLTTLWKRSVLSLHPAYHAANEVSNVMQQYLNGINPFKIIPEMYGAGKVQYGGAGESVAKGLTNKELLGEYTRRDVTGGGSLFGDTLSRAGYDTYGSNLRSLMGGNRVGSAIATGAETLGKMQTWGLRQGAKLEDNSKIAVANNFLKREHPNFGTYNPAQQSAALDSAAAFAKNAMVDYGALTPFEQTALRGVMPFYAWTQGIGRRSYELAKTHPERLAALDRFQNTVFQSPSERDNKVMAPWLKEQSPVTGAFGHDFGRDKQFRNMLLLNRFLPQGNLQQLASSPLDFAVSSVNPLLKGPVELLANKDTFKHGAIDDVAKGTLGGLTAPLTGDPYKLASQLKFGYNLPAAWNYVLNQAPGGRYITELSKMSDALGLSQNKLEKKPMSAQEALTWLGTGGRFSGFDEQTSLRGKQFEEKKDIGAIQRELKNREKLGDNEGVQFYQKELQNALQHQEFPSPKPTYGGGGEHINQSTGVPGLGSGAGHDIGATLGLLAAARAANRAQQGTNIFQSPIVRAPGTSQYISDTNPLRDATYRMMHYNPHAGSPKYQTPTYHSNPYRRR